MVAWSLVISLTSVLISKSQTQDATFNCFRRYTLIELVSKCFLSSIVGNMFNKPDREGNTPRVKSGVCREGRGEGDTGDVPLEYQCMLTRNF